MPRRLACAVSLVAVAVLGVLFATTAAAHPASHPRIVTSVAGADTALSSDSMPGMDMPGSSGTTPAAPAADYTGRYAVVGGFAALWVGACATALVLRRRGRAELDRRAAARAAAQAS
jgi:hypothetical protein